jgi:hypothetical protein
MFELPELERKTRHVITPDVVRGKRALFPGLADKAPDKLSA